MLRAHNAIQQLTNLTASSPHIYSVGMDKYVPPSVLRKEIIVAHKAAVATDDERCSIIGLNILRAGGNAVDAAVAAALALGVVSPASSGLGGGAFLILRLADGTTQAFDMRETAPMDARQDMYDGDATLKAKGGLSIAVPGELAGLYEVWEQYGTLSWKSLVKPAMDLAQGFIISDYLYWEMCLMESAIREDKGLRAIFMKDGELLQKGENCQNIKLAETLKKIALDGKETFYNGEIGDDLIKDIQDIGGIIKKDDLKNYKVKKREPIVAKLSKLEFIGMPPPSAGGAGLILMLNILDQFPFYPPSPLDSHYFDVSDDTKLHREIEALKHVFAVRLNIGDPDFVDVEEVISDMLSITFAKELQETIDDNKTFDLDHYGGRWNELHDYQMHEHGTSHLSVVDEQGNAVAMTSTVNYHFGAQILSPRTGILFNNEMDDFSIPSKRISVGLRANKEQPANFIRPGKRPLSSMSPTIILKNGKLKAVVGASGGTLIIPGVSEVFLNHFVKKMDEFPSVLAPRVYHQLIPNIVKYESFTTVTGDTITLPLQTVLALMQKGHCCEWLNSGAVCQLITFKELLTKNESKKDIVAVSDPRKGGAPAGY